MDMIENLIIAIVKPLISQPDSLTIKLLIHLNSWNIIWIWINLILDVSLVEKDAQFLQSERLSILFQQVIKSSFSDRRERIESHHLVAFNVDKGLALLTYRKEEMMNLIWTYLKKYPKWIALDLLGPSYL